MVEVASSSIVFWIVSCLAIGVFFGARIATWVHYRKLKGALCEKCIRDFWVRYRNADPKDE